MNPSLSRTAATPLSTAIKSCGHHRRREHFIEGNHGMTKYCDAMDELLKKVWLPRMVAERRSWLKLHREHLMYWKYPVSGMTDLEFRLYYRIPANGFYAFKKGQRISILHWPGKRREKLKTTYHWSILCFHFEINRYGPRVKPPDWPEDWR